MCLFSMKLIVILALNNYAIILRNICLIMIVIFVMANNLAGTYACVWGIIGDYVYTYVTSYPREEAYPYKLTVKETTKFI